MSIIIKPGVLEGHVYSQGCLFRSESKHLGRAAARTRPNTTIRSALLIIYTGLYAHILSLNIYQTYRIN